MPCRLRTKLILKAVLAHELAHMATRGQRAIPLGKLLKLPIANPRNWRIVTEKGDGAVIILHNLRFPIEGGARVEASGEVEDARHDVNPFVSG